MNSFLRIMIASIILLIAQKNLSAAARPAAEFQKDVQELVEKLASAELLPELNAEQEADFLLRILRDLSIPAVITNLAKAETTLSTKTDELHNLSANEGIFYLRLDNFHLSEPLQSAPWRDDFTSRKGCALVIDLRQVKGFSLAAEEANLNFLRELAVPMLILIDSATAGTPESMIRMLQEESEVMIMGIASLGIGGSGQEVKLSSGLTLRLPILKNGQLPPPLQPDIELSQDLETIIDPAMDPWCQHARDTLKVILTLGAHQKTP